MTAPNVFRAESERIPFASIDVRHSTPLHATPREILAEVFIHDLR